jgi:uncharacterized Zn-binding protein involved in type VI secretion
MSSQIPMARVGDAFAGICCCHVDPTCIGMTGVIVTGSPNTQADGIPVARVGDLVIGACGHSGVITSGSGNSQADGIPIARVGDGVAGCLIGTIVSGSPSQTTI